MQYIYIFIYLTYFRFDVVFTWIRICKQKSDPDPDPGASVPQKYLNHQIKISVKYLFNIETLSKLDK